jgi:hypothetical protein
MKFAFLILSCAAIFLLSCGDQKYYDVEDFRSVRKVDTHVHPNTENTAFLEQAREDNFIILAVNVDAPHYPSLDEQLRLAIRQKEAGPDHVDFLTTISLENWHDPHWADETIERLRDAFAKGALGIKMWKNIGMVYKDSSGNFIMADNPRFDPVIKFIIEQDKTVMAHLGEPKIAGFPLTR